MNKELLMKNLADNGFEPLWFDTAAEAAKYLNETLKGKKIVFGGSATLDTMGLYESLSENNEVFWHWRNKDPEARKKAEYEADVYMCSANGLSETGNIVNIDGNGNRLANAMYGHDVIYVVGKNKVVPTLDDAIARARNEAAPKNVMRFKLNNACVAGDEKKCFDCNGRTRICKVMSVIWRKPGMAGAMKVILVGEDMGY